MRRLRGANVPPAKVQRQRHAFLFLRPIPFGRQGQAITVHYIGNATLEEIILRNLREAISYVSRYENDFVREMSSNSVSERDRELVKSKTDLVKAENRVVELDDIIKHLYEDNIRGKLSDKRFIKLSGDYEREQDGLRSMADTLRKDIKEREQKKTDVRNFVAVTKKHTDLQELVVGESCCVRYKNVLKYRYQIR